MAIHRPTHLWRRVGRWLLASLVITSVVMGLAGDWYSVHLWMFTGGMSLLAAYAIFSAVDDDLARERFRPPSQGADETALKAIRILALAALVLAPLDSGRFHWSDVPSPLRTVGLAGALVGFSIVLRAMQVNRFFSAVIRLQDDRGHVVIDKGPYRIVRHPGYLGMVIFAPMAVIALGSWWALVPALLYAAFIVRRAFVEDRFLASHLSGYDDYRHRVRYLVVPGLC